MEFSVHRLGAPTRRGLCATGAARRPPAEPGEPPREPATSVRALSTWGQGYQPRCPICLPEMATLYTIHAKAAQRTKRLSLPSENVLNVPCRNVCGTRREQFRTYGISGAGTFIKECLQIKRLE